MKNIFYATKIDKNKNKLTVGYLTSKNRDRYGGDGAAKQDTVIFADFNEDGKLGLFDITKHAEVSGHVLRAMIVNNSTPATGDSEGQFVLYGKLNDKWSRTPFTFGDFSAANSAMKTMITQYQAMLVRDESEIQESGSEHETSDRSDDDLSIGE